MKRTLAGILIVLHGIAHSWLGVWASSFGPLWVVTPLWTIAMAGYVAAGFGIMRMRGLREVWPAMLVIASIASLILLGVYTNDAFVGGVVVDLAILTVVVGAILTQPTLIPPNAPYRHPAVATVVTGLAVAVLTYVTIVPVFRPLTTQWGTTAEERATEMLGDSLTPNAVYRLDHSITIRAPADSVWPWLVQLGQNRAGFYSYDWLERLAGDHVHNATRVHAEWQSLAEGDLVLAMQPGYMHGMLGDSLGWRVTRIEPHRALVLENWGAFILTPIDSVTTRLTVRTRGPGTPSLAAVVYGPINVFVFEPAHFIMQRGMLKGIRARAEWRPG
jgi:hypothetical protein